MQATAPCIWLVQTARAPDAVLLGGDDVELPAARLLDIVGVVAVLLCLIVVVVEPGPPEHLPPVADARAGRPVEVVAPNKAVVGQRGGGGPDWCRRSPAGK